MTSPRAAMSAAVSHSPAGRRCRARPRSPRPCRLDRPSCAALSIPRASPDTTLTPSRPSSCASPRAKRHAAALALRAPTIATIGCSSRSKPALHGHQRRRILQFGERARVKSLADRQEARAKRLDHRHLALAARDRIQSSGPARRRAAPSSGMASSAASALPKRSNNWRKAIGPMPGVRISRSRQQSLAHPWRGRRAAPPPRPAGEYCRDASRYQQPARPARETASMVTDHRRGHRRARRRRHPRHRRKHHSEQQRDPHPRIDRSHERGSRTTQDAEEGRHPLAATEAQPQPFEMPDQRRLPRREDSNPGPEALRQPPRRSALRRVERQDHRRRGLSTPCAGRWWRRYCPSPMPRMSPFPELRVSSSPNGIDPSKIGNDEGEEHRAGHP